MDAGPGLRPLLRRPPAPAPRRPPPLEKQPLPCTPRAAATPSCPPSQPPRSLSRAQARPARPALHGFCHSARAACRPAHPPPAPVAPAPHLRGLRAPSQASSLGPPRASPPCTCGTCFRACRSPHLRSGTSRPWTRRRASPSPRGPLSRCRSRAASSWGRGAAGGQACSRGPAQRWGGRQNEGVTCTGPARLHCRWRRLPGPACRAPPGPSSAVASLQSSAAALLAAPASPAGTHMEPRKPATSRVRLPLLTRCGGCSSRACGHHHPGPPPAGRPRP
jgi:hypothetical protein